MARRSVAGATYPPDWKAIAHRVKSEADWTCVRCGVRHDPPDHILLEPLEGAERLDDGGEA